MPVHATPPTPIQQALLDRFEAAGAVLDVAFFGYEPGDADVEREAVEQALAQLHGEPSGAPVGAPLAVLDWLTDSYDVVSGKLVLFRYSKELQGRSSTVDHGLPRALFDPPYGARFPELKLGWPKSVDDVTANDVTRGELLREFLSVIAGIEDPDDVADVALTEWSTDWHSYFDAGREWWGTFCWTLHRAEKREIVVISASTTD